MALTMESMVGERPVAECAELPSPAALRALIPCPGGVAEHVARSRVAVREILAERDPRLLVVVGPCSVHDVSAATEYAEWLAGQAAQFSDALLLVMRVYCDKPRTITGWNGLIHDPLLDGSGRIDLGLAESRQLLVDINAIGMPVATEFVEVIASQYLADVITWTAVGARTTESPLHRQMASGLPSPVGFKNATSGDLQTAINALIAARSRHRYLSVNPDGHVAMVTTSGNPDCHLVLRGGASGPNYGPETIAAAETLLRHAGARPELMVDCGHGNCGGDYRRQSAVVRELTPLIARGEQRIVGVMLESALVEGRQTLATPDRLVYGQSITDGCLGLADTSQALDALAAAVARRPRTIGSIAE